MSRVIGQPEPGFYKRRLVKGGPWVSVRFFLEADELRVEVDGRTHNEDGNSFDPYDEWPLCWPSSETEYKFFGQLREWATRFAPHYPAARPWSRIDLYTMPPRRRP
jgi:hypothetical protein